MVEIGPGLGALTQPLLAEVKNLHAVELDRRVLDSLSTLSEKCPTGTLHLHHTDALRFNYADLYQGQPLRLVGNLPYQISSPLLFHLLAQTCPIQDMHFMLQYEVVERMAAQPGSKAYGRLGIMLAEKCRVEKLFRVKPGAFNPPPKVDSAIVRLIPDKPAWAPQNSTGYAQIVSAAFSARRKTILNALSKAGDLNVNATLLESVNIDPKLRPENLSPQDYARLADAMLI